MQGEQDTERSVQLVHIGELIRAKRRAERLTLEEAARRSGVSAATLSRWERYRNADGAGGERDKHKLLAVARWLGVRLEGVQEDGFAEARPDPLVHGENEETVEIIEAHLRADPKLDPRTADALGRLFRIAYEQFTGTPPVHLGGTGDISITQAPAPSPSHPDEE